MQDVTQINRLPLNRYAREILTENGVQPDPDRVSAMQLVGMAVATQTVSLIDEDRHQLALTLETLESLRPDLQMKLLLGQDDPDEVGPLEVDSLSQLKDENSPQGLIDTLAQTLAIWAKYNLPDPSKVLSRQELESLVN